MLASAPRRAKGRGGGGRRGEGVGGGGQAISDPRRSHLFFARFSTERAGSAGRAVFFFFSVFASGGDLEPDLSAAPDARASTRLRRAFSSSCSCCSFSTS